MGNLFSDQNVGNWVGWNLYDVGFENLIQHVSRNKHEEGKTIGTPKYKRAEIIKKGWTRLH